MKHGKEPTRNHRMTSTADALGLDPKIGGHDRLVVLCLLAHAHAETGGVATAGKLAGLSKLRAEELVAGPLAGLVEAGYAETDVVQTPADAPTDVGGGAFTDATPSVSLWQVFGYRITKEGLDALDGHLSALGALPGSLRTYLLDEFPGRAAPEEDPGAAGEGG